ncbi:MAG: glycosyltransferase family A protein [Dermatophilaceae bacterium]
MTVPAPTSEALAASAADRSVHSIGISGDLLAPDRSDDLRDILAFARTRGAHLVVVGRNAAHEEVVMRLVGGQDPWRMPDAPEGWEPGAFARTYGDWVTRLALAELTVIAEGGVSWSPSGRTWDANPALAPKTSVHLFLSRTMAASEARGTVYEFVWLCTPTPVPAEPGDRVVATQKLIDGAPNRPFLTVVMRTQGTRPECLTEALLCLAAQDCADFEVVIVGHRLSEAGAAEIGRIVADCVSSLRARIRVVTLDEGGRAAPLNLGFALARGRYIAILDDDDLVMEHWVSTFKAAEVESGGRIIRTVSILQRYERVTVNGAAGTESRGPLEAIYPAEFDLVEHLNLNYTPNTALAFPTGVRHVLGLAFDDRFTTVEDWDLLMRSATVVGVYSVPAATCIYRWWLVDESSRTLHAEAEWVSNLAVTYSTLDVAALLLQPGSAGHVRNLIHTREELTRSLAAATAEVERQRRDLDWFADELDRQRRQADSSAQTERTRLGLLREIQEILASTSWKIASPLRIAPRLRERQPPTAVHEYFEMTSEELHAVLEKLRSSVSWTATRRLRGRR